MRKDAGGGGGEKVEKVKHEKRDSIRKVGGDKINNNGRKN